jgi:hypothetical protein
LCVIILGGFCLLFC